MTCLPFTNNLEFLVELSLIGSKLEKLWDGTKLLRNLKWVNLSYSRNLKELPNLSTATSLKTLWLMECSSLVELPFSIGNATNLEDLVLSGCSSLVELPFSIGNATNLDTLSLSKCSSLVELPFSIGNLHKLEILYLDGCSSLVELPFSIGYLHNLETLDLGGCSKLNALPININMESLDFLDLGDCWSLKSFPEISTNIEYLNLVGTSIKEVPRSIRTWSRLNNLCMSYSENLKEFPFIHHIITELHLSDTGIQELGPWVKGFSRLDRLVVKGMQKLVSLPQLPDSLRFLNAENCVSLEKLDCFFCNPHLDLDFRNCFKLNKEARDLINQTSTIERVVLPGKEVPACFTYRASGNSVTVKLKQKPLRTSSKFKACFLFVNNGENEASEFDYVMRVYWSMINSKEEALVARRPIIYQMLTEHLYIFDFVAEGVTSTEFVFKFELTKINCNNTWEIKECGIFPTLGATC